jgi:hypothetical protein
MDDSSLLKRPNFFFGKLLTAEDLAEEQQYVIEKFKRHNRTLHGFGIVSGLKVSARAGHINVTPGIALDCEGNELVIDCAQSLVVPATSADCVSYLNLRFAVKPENFSSKTDANELRESFELSFADENCNRGHRHARGRWLACGKAHALTIAKLKRSANAWRVERGYRPPTVK